MVVAGVWGSAFTILIKRLVMEGGKKDIVQIMRDAQKEENMQGEDSVRDEGRTSQALVGWSQTCSFFLMR